MTESERLVRLTRAIRAESPLQSNIRALRELPWDAEELVVILAVDDGVDVLVRHASGEIDDGDLVEWANALEARDDVGLDPRGISELRECLFQLATPELTGKAISQLAEECRVLLEPLTG